MDANRCARSEHAWNFSETLLSWGQAERADIFSLSSLPHSVFSHPQIWLMRFPGQLRWCDVSWLRSFLPSSRLFLFHSVVGLRRVAQGLGFPLHFLLSVWRKFATSYGMTWCGSWLSSLKPFSSPILPQTSWEQLNQICSCLIICTEWNSSNWKCWTLRWNSWQNSLQPCGSGIAGEGPH